MKFLKHFDASDKEIRMLKREIQKAVLFFYQSIFHYDKSITNSRSSDLSDIYSAIEKGIIKYDNKKITGNFNAKISLALKRLGAVYSNKTFTLPSTFDDSGMLAATTRGVIKDGTSYLLFEKALSEVDVKKVVDCANLDEVISGIVKSINESHRDGAKNALAVKLQLDETQEKMIADEYINNVKMHIEGFADSELVKLRKKVRENYEKGIRYNVLAKDLEKKYKLAPDRAMFIARVETKRLVVAVKKARYLKGGMDLYVWKTMNDSRVRSTHKVLHNTTQSWSLPPIVNEQGDRLHPSEDVNCRCWAIPKIA